MVLKRATQQGSVCVCHCSMACYSSLAHLSWLVLLVLCCRRPRQVTWVGEVSEFCKWLDHWQGQSDSILPITCVVNGGKGVAVTVKACKHLSCFRRIFNVYFRRKGDPHVIQLPVIVKIWDPHISQSLRSISCFIVLLFVDPLSSWSADECANFVSGLRQYGKDFYLIHQNKVMCNVYIFRN